MGRDTVLDNKSGQMEQSMRESGCSTKQTAKVSSGMRMETSTKASGRTIRQTDLASILM